MSYNLTEKRQKLKLQLEGRLAEEEIRKRSVNVTKLHIPTIFRSVPDFTKFENEENDPNKFPAPNDRLNKSTKNMNKVPNYYEETQFRNNYLKPVNKELSPTTTTFNFLSSKEKANTPRENTYYEIDSPEQTVTLRTAEPNATQDLNVYDIPPPRLPSKGNTNLETNASASASNDISKTALFKKNNIFHKLSIKDESENPLSPKSPMFETLQKIPVLKRSGSRVAFYAKEETETQITAGRDCPVDPVSGDYLYMTAQLGTDLNGMYSNITLAQKETDWATAVENDEVNKQLLEEDHYENFEIIRQNYLLLKKPPTVVRIEKKPIPALRQKTSK